MAQPASLTFSDSPRSSVGLEWELALVDADSGELRQAATAVLDAVHADGIGRASCRERVLACV